MSKALSFSWLSKFEDLESSVLHSFLPPLSLVSSPSHHNDFSFVNAYSIVTSSPLYSSGYQAMDYLDTEHYNSFLVSFFSPFMTFPLISTLQRIFILIFLKHLSHHTSSYSKFFSVPLTLLVILKHFLPSISNNGYSKPLAQLHPIHL